MNYSMIFFIIGWVFIIEAALMAPSALVAVLYSERSIWAFAAAIGLCLLLGVPLVRKQPANKVFYAKEGCVTVALSWIVMSLMGALPFVFSGVIPSIVDAMFETVSGWKSCPGACCSGGALPTGSAAWAFWYSCYASCPCPAAVIP